MAGAVQGLVFCALVSLAAAAGCERYCYTRWLNRDSPTGTGDYETLHNFKTQSCPRPVGIQCQTTSGKPYKTTGDSFAVDCDPRGGLACRNNEQAGGKQCNNYRVRFLCPQGTIQDTRGMVCKEYCVSQFYDRDNPSGKCDCEQLSLGPYKGPAPVGIRCIDRATGKDYQDIGQKMTCKPDFGGVCWNDDNPGNPCKDYLVQYIHPCQGKEEVEMETFQTDEVEKEDSGVEIEDGEEIQELDVQDLLFSLLSKKI